MTVALGSATAAGPTASEGTATFSAAAAAFPAVAAFAARSSADFTIEISGSGGTNGFFSTPSAPTR